MAYRVIIIAPVRPAFHRASRSGPPSPIEPHSALCLKHIKRQLACLTPNPLIGLPTSSTDDGAFHPQQLTKLAQLAGYMADADRAMMRWAFGVPGIQECSRSHRETVAAVGVTNFENRAGLGNGVSDQQFKFSVRRLNN